VPRKLRREAHGIVVAGAVSLLLAALFGRTMERPPLQPEPPLPLAATPHRGPRPRMELVVLAVALCVALAATTIGVLQWRQAQEDDAVARALTGGDPTQAQALVARFGCGGCHTIPGLPGAAGQVAAPLISLRKRVYIAGVVRNTPDNLIQWIVDPHSLSPRSAMPVTGISRREAVDVAAYLYAH
jgi:mono/diheme cytochrome c family protein